MALSWEFPGRWGQLPMPLPDVTGDDTDVLCAVGPGDSPMIVAAYERAARMAEQLWDALDRAGLGPEVIAVVLSLAADLRPVVRVQLTPAGARQVRWLFDGDTGPPATSDRGDDGSWVARTAGVRSVGVNVMGTAVDVREFDALMEKVSKRGYLWYHFGEDHHGPRVLAGVFQWLTCADVVVLTDDRDSHADRTPTPVPDVFAPSQVHWWYGRSDSTVRRSGTVLPGISMVWVLRALLTLPRPDQRYGLPPLRPAPPGTGVPGGAGDRIPVRMRRWLGR